MDFNVVSGGGSPSSQSNSGAGSSSKVYSTKVGGITAYTKPTSNHQQYPGRPVDPQGAKPNSNLGPRPGGIVDSQAYNAKSNYLFGSNKTSSVQMVFVFL